MSDERRTIYVCPECRSWRMEPGTCTRHDRGDPREGAVYPRREAVEVMPVQSVERPAPDCTCDGGMDPVPGYWHDGECPCYIPEPTEELPEPVERPRDAEAVERVYLAVERLYAESVEVKGRRAEYVTAYEALSEAVAALGPVERPCEITDAMVKAAIWAFRRNPSDRSGLPAMRRALEAALGAVEEGEPDG